MQFSSDKFIHLYTRRQKHKYTNTTHIIVYLKITAGESPQHKETIQLICHANKLIDFLTSRALTERKLSNRAQYLP